jgi:hypothetical protein
VAEGEWRIEDERSVEPSPERDVEAAYEFRLRSVDDEEAKTIVEYESGAGTGSVTGARQALEPYVKRDRPPPRLILDSRGLSRADYEGIDWPEGERDRLVQHRAKATESFDRTVLTLASGALGLTVAFIHEIAPHPRHVWVVAVGWSFLCGSLLLILASFLSSIAEHSAIIDQMDERVSTIRRPIQWTTSLNVAAASCLVLGVVFVVTFACLNLSHAQPGKKAGTRVRRAAGTAQAHGDRGQARRAGQPAHSPAKARDATTQHREDKLELDGRGSPSTPRGRGAGSSETAYARTAKAGATAGHPSTSGYARKPARRTPTPARPSTAETKQLAVASSLGDSADRPAVLFGS